MRTIPSIRLLAVAGLLLVVSGCGADGPPLADVSGTVTLDGKPVPNALVEFVPRGPNATPSYDRTDAEGYYELRFTRDKDGAMIGTHDVRLRPHPPLTPTKKAIYKEKSLPLPEIVSIPQKYFEPDALTAEVEEGDNTIDFELTSE